MDALHRHQLLLLLLLLFQFSAADSTAQCQAPRRATEQHHAQPTPATLLHQNAHKHSTHTHNTRLPHRTQNPKKGVLPWSELFILGFFILTTGAMQKFNFIFKGKRHFFQRMHDVLRKMRVGRG
jgi:hypothetical protein